MSKESLKPTFRMLALRNYCIATGNYDEYVRATLTRKTDGGNVEYVNPERAEKFIHEMKELFSPYIYDWDMAPEGVPTVPQFREALNRNKIANKSA